MHEISLAHRAWNPKQLSSVPIEPDRNDVPAYSANYLEMALSDRGLFLAIPKLNDEAYGSAGNTTSEVYEARNLMMLYAYCLQMLESFFVLEHNNIATRTQISIIDSNEALWLKPQTIAASRTISPAHPSPGAPTLVSRIRAVLEGVELDPEEAVDASKAVEDACAFVSREIPDETPIVMVSDDGVVMLQWRRSDSGVLLAFSGDGTVTVSVKRPGGMYSSNPQNIPIAYHLPDEARAAIEKFAAP